MHAGVMSCSPQPDATRTASSPLGNTQRSQSTHASVPSDAAVCLQSIVGDVNRDVAAAQQRAKLLQEEVDSLVARIADTQESATAAHDDNDPVMKQIEAIRQARQE